MRIAADMVVNAAGLGAQAVARSIAGMPPTTIPPLHLAKGNYFSLAGALLSRASSIQCRLQAASACI